MAWDPENQKLRSPHPRYIFECRGIGSLASQKTLIVWEGTVPKQGKLSITLDKSTEGASPCGAVVWSISPKEAGQLPTADQIVVLISCILLLGVIAILFPVRCCRGSPVQLPREDPIDDHRPEASILPWACSHSLRAHAVFRDNAVSSRTLGRSQEQVAEVRQGDEDQLSSTDGQHSPLPGMLDWAVAMRPVADTNQEPSADSRHLDLEDAFSSLGCKRFRSKLASTPVPEVCAICIMEVSSGEALYVIDVCGHVFHAGCINRWLRVSTLCPLCRQEIFWVSAHAGDSDMNSDDSTMIEAEEL
eukprot:gnl/TRDRNA2_/TRDRNA2_178000_c1_seq4.p1 gnl/TRDRNA2_/TRDRNA2_178000_c1~~gnl/TRDRNA2_/TRDRNA2_178000_c1_seq4.p1  ORF type:complete len:341 (-),score=29.51 gnl/TRDRNA2_/TRDRNA2_178000_c1_seq4:134-1042(-)